MVGVVVGGWGWGAEEEGAVEPRGLGEAGQGGVAPHVLQAQPRHGDTVVVAAAGRRDGRDLVTSDLVTSDLVATIARGWRGAGAGGGSLSWRPEKKKMSECFFCKERRIELLTD